MRLSERPLTFEQEYPKHTFAPLVALAVAAAAWAVRRRTTGRAKAAGARVRPVAGGLSLSRHLALAVTVTLAVAGTSSHVRAESDSTPMVAHDPAPGAKILASVIAHYQADGLDTYAQDMRAFGRSASAPTIAFDTCTGSRASASMRKSGQGAAPSATRESPAAVPRYIDPPAARKLFQGAEFNVKDGLDVYEQDLGVNTGSLLAVSTR